MPKQFAYFAEFPGRFLPLLAAVDAAEQLAEVGAGAVGSVYRAHRQAASELSTVVVQQPGEADRQANESQHPITVQPTPKSLDCAHHA